MSSEMNFVAPASGEYSFAIYSASGRKIFDKQSVECDANQHVALPTKDVLGKGLYILEVKAESFVYRDVVRVS